MPSPYAFYFANGQYAETIEELRARLAAMDESYVRRHVGGERNDFARWVHDVFGYERLAQNLAHARSQQELIDTLDGYLLGGYDTAPVKVVTDEFVRARSTPTLQRPPPPKPVVTTQPKESSVSTPKEPPAPLHSSDDTTIPNDEPARTRWSSQPPTADKQEEPAQPALRPPLPKHTSPETPLAVQQALERGGFTKKSSVREFVFGMIVGGVVATLLIFLWLSLF